MFPVADETIRSMHEGKFVRYGATDEFGSVGLVKPGGLMTLKASLIHKRMRRGSDGP